MPSISCPNCGRSFQNQGKLNLHRSHKLECKLAWKRGFLPQIASSGASQAATPTTISQPYSSTIVNGHEPSWIPPSAPISVVIPPAASVRNRPYYIPGTVPAPAPPVTPTATVGPIRVVRPTRAPVNQRQPALPAPAPLTVNIPAPRQIPRLGTDPKQSLPSAPNIDPGNGNIRTTRPLRYGYATVKQHPTAGKVLRYEPSAPESRRRGHKTPDELSKEKELFELAEWLANMSCTDRDREGYFKFKVHQKNLPWRSLAEMYRAIDNFEHGPEFTHKMFNVATQQGSEDQHVYARCPLEITQDLIGEVEWKDHMSYGPRSECVRTEDGREIPVYSEMCSGKYWARMQTYLPEGALFIPAIVSTDPTRLSVLSGDKKANPVYYTIGNIDKAIRNRPSERAMVLLGYLPEPKLEFITNPRERREKKWQVYHAAMRLILDPLKKAGEEGFEVRCADGGVRRGYPIVSAQIGDWMELCTGACSFHTRCPECTEDYKHRGHLGEPACLRTKHQTLQAIFDAMNGHALNSKRLGLRPIWPYWADLPYANGAQLIVPDLLHQVHKGMFKTHLFEWWTTLLGEDELDRRYKGLPRFHGLRHFEHGLSVISQWTGNEAKQIERTFLPVVAEKKPSGALLAMHALMDFFLRAHSPQLDEDDLTELDARLVTFHGSKEVFRTSGAFKSKHGWNRISKLHMLRHFTHQIREMGATDGYTTETSERCHKYWVKNPYRQTSKAGNTTEEMLVRFQREEAWDIARARLERAGKIPKLKLRERVGDVGDFGDQDATVEGEYEFPAERQVEEMRPGDGEPVHFVRSKETSVIQPSPLLDIAKRPTEERLPLAHVAETHEAPGLWEALQDYVDEIDPGLTFQLSDSMKIGVWSFCKLIHSPLPFAPLVGSLTDFVRATPAKVHADGRRTREANYDTVLIETYENRQGIHRYRVGRVRVIFKLPCYALDTLPEPLAFVELFDRFGSQSRPAKLFSTRPSRTGQFRKTEVIPLSRIRMACHLVPKYSDEVDKRPLSSADDLVSSFPAFYLNPASSYYSWALFDHWERLNVS